MKFEIFTKGWQWANEQVIKFQWQSGSPSGFSRFVTIGRYAQWLTDINLLLILIHQTAALVRRALAEVCTVPVLLVMVALWNRADHYISCCGLLLFFFFFSSPNLSRRRLDVCHTSTHGVALVQI